MARTPAALIVLCLAPAVLAGVQPPVRTSGLSGLAVDGRVRPQDDLYRYVNGGWLDAVDMPSDRVMYGAFVELAEKVEQDLRVIIEDAAARPGRRRGSPQQQIGDLYRSVMDEARVEAVGAAPIAPVLARIEAIASTRDLAVEAGRLGSVGAGGPFAASVLVADDQTSRVYVQVSQGGTLLPNRDYYLDPDARFEAVRAGYVAYLTRIFTLVGRKAPAEDAASVLALETALARIQLPPVQSRAAARAATAVTLSELARTLPGFDWDAWAKPQGIDRAAGVALLQPSFFSNFARLVPSTPLSTWKAWLAARYVTASAPYLSGAFNDARFDFFGRTLTGQTVPRPRWKVGISTVSLYLSEPLGRLYVERHLPEASRTRAARMVDEIIRAYRSSIDAASWLSRGTRSEAAAKLARLTTRVGSPERWRSYAELSIDPGDFFGNIERARKFDSAFRTRQAAILESQGEWLVSPQTVNAYYNPGRNELVLPAALLQPPLFDPQADDAVNFGALGATVGHELAHALDERGRRYDAVGAVRDWWTPAEEREYRARALALTRQINAIEPLPGERLNGELTLGESLADVAGLSLAHEAYQASLEGRAAPVLDGFTGDQRFMLAWARMWRAKVSEDYLRQWLRTFQYAPYPYRANVAASNLPAFYEAFGVKPGDRLYLEPAARVGLW